MSMKQSLSKEDLLSCLELGKSLTSELNSEKLFSIILKKLSKLIPAKNWSMFLLDEENEDLYFSICVGIDTKKLNGVRIKVGEGIVGTAVKNMKPVIVKDVSNCDFFTAKIDDLSGFETKSVIAVPLIFHNQVVGAIEAINPNLLDERVTGLLELIADIAAIAVENTRRYHEIELKANQDNLTGLYNTRYFYKNLTEMIANNKGEPISIIFMDIDNFKFVVDTHGHLNGSQAIQEVAAIIKSLIKKPEFAVSYAGDEFIIVLPGYDKKQALKKAEEVREKMSNTLYLCDKDLNIKLSASFGISSYPDDAKTLKEVISIADKAMFTAKDRGKNGVCGE